MSVSRWLGIAGGILLCVSAFTPLRTASTMQVVFMAINDPLVVSSGGWLLIVAGVIVLVSTMIGRNDTMIASAVFAAAASAFVAGLLRGSFMAIEIWGNELVKSSSSQFTVPSWGWLLVVGGVVLVTAAAILAKVPRNSATALQPAQQTGD